MQSQTKLPSTNDVLDCARAVTPFASSLGQAFASIPLGPEAQQVVPIRSPRFRGWLADNVFRQFDAPPLASALQGALRQLEAAAWFNESFHNGARPHIARRIAARPGRVILDLYNESGDVVEIDAAGRRTLPSLGFFFSNTRNARPLPAPAESSQPSALRQFRALLGVESPQTWATILAWILASLRPSGPYPILILQGPAGSGKSTLARLLRTLLDPNAVPFQPLPRSENDLLHMAHSHWILAFDHVRRLPFRLTDTLVRLSSGAVLALRETTGDLDPVHLYLQRPVILTVPADNCAVTWTTRASVAANAMVIDLPALPVSQLRPQHELVVEFEALQPGVLAILCDAVSAALAQPTAAPSRSASRFIELVNWLHSAAPAVGVPANQLLAWLSVPDNPLLDAIQILLSERTQWTGTPTALLQALPGLAKSAHALTRLLNKLEPTGFRIEHGRLGKKGERRIVLTKADATSPQLPSACSLPPAQVAEYKTARI